jgi:hypothetical protein
MGSWCTFANRRQQDDVIRSRIARTRRDHLRQHAAPKDGVARAHGGLQGHPDTQMRLAASPRSPMPSRGSTGLWRLITPGFPSRRNCPSICIAHLGTSRIWTICSPGKQRSLSTSQTLQYDKVVYLVDPSRENQTPAGARVTIIDDPDGRIKIRFERPRFLVPGVRQIYVPSRYSPLVL